VAVKDQLPSAARVRAAARPCSRRRRQPGLTAALRGSELQRIRRLGPLATRKCSAALVGTLLLLLACRHVAGGASPSVYRVPAPDPPGETSCAWFGDVEDGVLYFGVSAFWSALRAAGGAAVADLAAPGPRWIGRFDLAREVFLPPLAAGPEVARSGVWDVLVHPNGRVYFTTYFDFAGSFDLASGTLTEFPGAGLGLNELALGPDGHVLVTRYGFGDDLEGSVVELSEAGEVLAEHVLSAPPGRRVLAKSLSFDPRAGEIWVNTDLLPANGAGDVLHDARVLALDGTERLSLGDPELQFFTFGADGTGYLAEASDGRLRLRVRWPAGATPRERFVPLDDAFDAAHDFVQEIRAEPDGRVVVTRWSGRIHVVSANGGVQDLELPRTEAGELYYTGTLVGSRVCATRCGRVEVVCANLPN
jgi:hypothetical protein